MRWSRACGLETLILVGLVRYGAGFTGGVRKWCVELHQNHSHASSVGDIRALLLAYQIASVYGPSCTLNWSHLGRPTPTLPGITALFLSLRPAPSDPWPLLLTLSCGGHTLAACSTQRTTSTTFLALLVRTLSYWSRSSWRRTSCTLTGKPCNISNAEKFLINTK